MNVWDCWSFYICLCKNHSPLGMMCYCNVLIVDRKPYRTAWIISMKRGRGSSCCNRNCTCLASTNVSIEYKIKEYIPIRKIMASIYMRLSCPLLSGKRKTLTVGSKREIHCGNKATHYMHFRVDVFTSLEPIQGTLQTSKMVSDAGNMTWDEGPTSVGHLPTKRFIELCLLISTTQKGENTLVCLSALLASQCQPTTPRKRLHFHFVPYVFHWSGIGVHVK